MVRVRVKEFGRMNSGHAHRLPRMNSGHALQRISLFSKPPARYYSCFTVRSKRREQNKPQKGKGSHSQICRGSPCFDRPSMLYSTLASLLWLD